MESECIIVDTIQTTRQLSESPVFSESTYRTASTGFWSPATTGNLFFPISKIDELMFDAINVFDFIKI